MERILVVDDDAEHRATLRDALLIEGYLVGEARDGVEGLAAFDGEPPDAVLLDLRMPRKGGLEVLREMRERAPQVPVIILTGHADVSTAVAAVKGGAADFAMKPLDVERLLLSLRQALDRGRLEREVRSVSAELDASLEGTFGPSRAMRAVTERIRKVARTDLAIVVTGETGTGKTLVSQAVHRLGPRAACPFVRVDISVIPPTLAESELFGARRGAYTGSERDRSGYFAGADGGTLFLDDIENVPRDIQAKLLDVIENRRVHPVGGGEAVTLDVRVIAATNRDLRQLAAAGEFRTDLLYRLEEFAIALPPLRDRPEDIRYFMDKFLLEAAADLGRQFRGYSPSAEAALVGHSWPGNVRELRNVVRRAAIMATGDVLQREQIDFAGETPEAGDGVVTLREAVRRLERVLVTRALEACGGNRTRAAEQLGISTPTLLAKIREHGLG